MTPRGDGVGGNDARPGGSGAGIASRDVRTRILASAMTILSTDGLDAMSLPHLAAHAGMSTGPVYSRWDSGEDVALELWEGELFGHLEMLLGTLDDAMSSDGSRVADATSVLVAELQKPSPKTLALTEVLLVFRRFPWLSASIAGSLDQLFGDYIMGDGDTERSFRFEHLNVVLGALCMGHLIEGTPVAWDQVFRSMRTVARGPLRYGPIEELRSVDSSVVRYLPPPRGTTGDEIVDTFLDACFSVISRSGYERATAHRISRAAGLTFSHVYNHFDTKEDLMRTAVSTLIAGFRSSSSQTYRNYDPVAYATVVLSVMRGMWDEPSLALSRLRAEMTVAARHHRELGDALRAGLAAPWQAPLDRLPSDVIPAAAHMRILLSLGGLGLSVLSLAFPSSRQMDLVPLVLCWMEVTDVMRPHMLPPGDTAQSTAIAEPTT